MAESVDVVSATATNMTFTELDPSEILQEKISPGGGILELGSAEGIGFIFSCLV